MVELELHSSRAETADGNSKPFCVRDFQKAVFLLDVTAVSGTFATGEGLTVTIENYDPITEETDTLASFTANITAPTTEWKYAYDTGKELTNFIRVKWTITGTTPSFTFSVVAHLKKTE